MQATAIRVLDDATIAQIAAGEVIERPVSVVKELVENSLDAGAKRIDVELRDGGRALIGVSDDGCGISRDELRLAFARHATSKLSAADELFAIRTLGFRGEGLASIAAAGAVELVSRVAADDLGARVEARGTTVGEPSAAAASIGTKVIVRDLFALTPARREFLKSGKAELARVSAFLTQIAVGWPRVAFSMRHDDRDVWVLPAVTSGVERLEAVFGRDSRGWLAAIVTAPEHRRERVGGHISRPGRDRPNRNAQVFFVNGRLVRSAALSAAWLAGYGSFGMTGRYPFGALSIDLPPEDVDVNVHPTKIEVRFAYPQPVFDAVRSAVARTLREEAPARVFSMPGMPIGPEPASLAMEASNADAAPMPLSFGPSDRAEPRVLAQVDRTYIVLQTGDEMLVVDQHAAHERIAYEALLDGPPLDAAASPLLFPTVVELTPERAAALDEHAAVLASAGIEIEPFGAGVVRIRALPAGYETRRFDLPGILDDLAAEDAPREGVAHRQRMLATIACHSVVRAGDPLSLQEQSALYRRLLRCREPQTCPHGRPTILRLNRDALARAFKRA